MELQTTTMAASLATSQGKNLAWQGGVPERTSKHFKTWTQSPMGSVIAASSNAKIPWQLCCECMPFTSQGLLFQKTLLKVAD